MQRAQRRWAQQQAAAALGMTFYRYRNIEAGQRPTDDEAAKIAQVFGLTDRALRAALKATGNGEAASVA